MSKNRTIVIEGEHLVVRFHAPELVANAVAWCRANGRGFEWFVEVFGDELVSSLAGYNDEWRLWTREELANEAIETAVNGALAADFDAPMEIEDDVDLMREYWTAPLKSVERRERMEAAIDLALHGDFERAHAAAKDAYEGITWMEAREKLLHLPQKLGPVSHV